MVMEIQRANPEDKDEIVRLYKRVQSVTGIPDPEHIAPDELEGRIYSDRAIERYTIRHLGRIAGHGLIEHPDPGHEEIWRAGLSSNADDTLIELGGAFVDPDLKGLGMWTALLEYRLDIIKGINAVPVSATWMQNEHVKRTFQKYGGQEVGQQQLPAGKVSLFVFNPVER
jgi:GNAT superfamily N-acetyltransferase